jgi:hypothetical protein
MSGAKSPSPVTLGLFEKRFDGDDSLMALARLRFREASMGTEIHAGAPEPLRELLRLRPWPEAPVVIHLPRHFDLLQESTLDRIVELSSHAAGTAIGCVLHDQQAMVERSGDYLAAVRRLDHRLRRIANCPVVFIEYAVGLELAAFVEFWRSIAELSHISPCIDTGHVGIRATRAAYAQTHPGEDVCALKSQGPALADRIGEVQKAVATGQSAVFQLVDDLATIVANKRLHFHLHDGHPLSRSSPFGVADHLSFVSEIPIEFDYCGRHSLPPMFGRSGLAKIVEGALRRVDAERVSFTLEIHPTHQRLALSDASDLFQHWSDKTNAELMNHWLGILVTNHELLLESIRRAPFNLEKREPLCPCSTAAPTPNSRPGMCWPRS